MLYRRGYGRQHLDSEGNQTESYPDLDPRRHLEDTGLEMALPLDGKVLNIRLWMTKIVGTMDMRSPFILDSRHEENDVSHIGLSDTLYGGDDRMRIRQEFMLELVG